MFTRTHFEAVAKILRAARVPTDAVITQSVDKLVDDFADCFAESNPLFDRARFFAASGHVPGLTITEV